MIPLLQLLGATDAQAMTALDAERAFAADAKTLGQWTAFRKWSTDDAVMFVPQPTNAHDFLKDRKDPPKAIDWWPTASYISCDGSLAANTGGWARPDGSVGYFTTVWQKQSDGTWKWIVDGGDGVATPRPRPSAPKVVRAKCKEPPPFPTVYGVPPPNSGMEIAYGYSRDRSLQWYWRVNADGSRALTVNLEGSLVIDDRIAGSPANK